MIFPVFFDFSKKMNKKILIHFNNNIKILNNIIFIKNDKKSLIYHIHNGPNLTKHRNRPPRGYCLSKSRQWLIFERLPLLWKWRIR
jgi:hypothetical protein